MKSLVFGDPVKDWRGSGDLLHGDRTFPCVFELVQIGSGRIVLTCDVEGLAWLEKGDARLVGHVDAGDDAFVERCFVRSCEPKTKDGLRTVVRMRAGSYEVRNEGETPSASRYGLTNVQSIGNDAYRPPGGGGQRQARFNLDGVDVVIRPVKDSRELCNEAQATRGVAVTAHALISAAAEDRERVEEVLGRLCLLLTLAQGHRVEWIYCEDLDDKGSLLSVRGRDAVTKPWGGLHLVSDEATCRFVETAYPHFASASEPWGLEKAILSYNDAKLEGDYLEFRALKMAVVLEYLKGRYLAAQRLPKAPPFRKAVAGLFSSLSVPLSEDELAVLVRIRNSLVHEATFWSGKGAPREREQYLILTTVIGRVLLAILRYQGEYYDWRGASDGQGPRKATLSVPSR